MEEKETKDIKGFKKQKAFNVPDNYFEEFALNMQHTIGDSSNKNSWFDRLIKALYLRVSIPLSSALILAYGIILLSQSEKDQENLTYADAKMYLLSVSESIEEEELYDLTYNISIENNTNEESQKLIDYLIDTEDIDLEIIENSINEF